VASGRSRAGLFTAALLLVAIVALPAASQVSVDALLQRALTDPSPAPYSITADFDGTFTFIWRGGRLVARLLGYYREWRPAAGQPRRRQVTITEVHAPLILRPFVGDLKRLLAERIEQEEGALGLFEDYDAFIVEEQPNGRYLIGGVRTDIVREIMRRYSRDKEDIKDPNIRRAVARWLFLPAQREMIVRKGKPYVVTAVLDGQGAYYQMQLLYEWGPLGTQLDWTKVGGRLVWRTVKMDARLNAGNIGQIDGRLDLTFKNHCANCTR
jgi:hypothetical protein